MLLAKIVGTVVATRKDPRLVSSKLLVARPVDPRGKAEGNYLVAVDTVDAGVGETVLIVSGSSARMASGMKDCPVDAAIVGIIDTVDDRSVAAARSMQLARVIGDVVATIKDDNLTGIKLLLLQPLDPDASRPAGRSSRSTRSAPASAKRCSSSAARKRAFRSIPPSCRSTPASSASSITGRRREAQSSDPCRSRGHRHGRLDAEAPQVRRGQAAAGAAAQRSTTRRAARRCWRWMRSAPASASGCSS